MRRGETFNGIFFFVLFLLFNLQNKSPSASLLYEIATTLICREAREMFCGLRNYTFLLKTLARCRFRTLFCLLSKLMFDIESFPKVFSGET